MTTNPLHADLVSLAPQWHCTARHLQWPAATSPSLASAIHALSMAFENETAPLTLQAPAPCMQSLVNTGIALQSSINNNYVEIPSDLFWQHPENWLPHALPPLPLRYQISDGRRHPLRRAQSAGVVYQRHIPWLQQTLSFRVADTDIDLPHFHRWMNDPHVAEFWQESGSEDDHRRYLDKIHADAHSTPLIACLDDLPFGYFEVYWAKEDRLAPFYDVADFDRGWHVLIGEAAYRGKDFVSAWLPSISHYLFLDDCRTQRLVIEPRSDNKKMRHNLQRSGYALIKEFDFPHKRAVLGSLLRERFFAEQLWLPTL